MQFWGWLQLFTELALATDLLVKNSMFCFNIFRIRYSCSSTLTQCFILWLAYILIFFFLFFFFLYKRENLSTKPKRRGWPCASVDLSLKAYFCFIFPWLRGEKKIPNENITFSLPLNQAVNHCIICMVARLSANLHIMGAFSAAVSHHGNELVFY